MRRVTGEVTVEVSVQVDDDADDEHTEAAISEAVYHRPLSILDVQVVHDERWSEGE